jgi:hypothetical protein
VIMSACAVLPELWLPLATISGKILTVECAGFDGKTIMPNWNSQKNKRIALCLSDVRRIQRSPLGSHNKALAGVGITPAVSKCFRFTNWIWERSVRSQKANFGRSKAAILC